MVHLKSSLLAVFLLCSMNQYAQYTDLINSNRPGESMSAFSVGKTVIQAEGGLYGINEKHSIEDYEATGFGTELDLRYGVFWEQFEFDLNTQYQYDWYQAALVDDTRGGFRQFIIGAKYLVYDPFLKRKEDKPNLLSWKANHSSKFKWSDFIPAVALYGGLNLQFGTNPYTFESDPAVSPKLMAITQNQFGTKWVLVTNFIADKVTTEYPSLGIIATLTRGFNMRWSGFAEVQGYKSDYYSDTVLRTGAAYMVWENMQLDASISKNFKDTPSIIYGGVGMSWRFDANYQTDYVRIKKDKKKVLKTDKKKKGNKQKSEKELENFKP